MLGACIGDIVGSVYEFNAWKSREFPLFSEKSEFTDDAIRNAVSLGRDADTLAAIAGPIAEVRFGIPEEIRRKGWMRLPKDMRDILDRLYAKAAA